MKCNFCGRDLTNKNDVSSGGKHYCNLSCLKKKLKEGVESD
jgi:hypothetical protein